MSDETPEQMRSRRQSVSLGRLYLDPEQLSVRGPYRIPARPAGARLRSGRAAAHDQLRAGTPTGERSRPDREHQGKRLARHRSNPGPAYGSGSISRGRREPARSDAQVFAASIRRRRYRSRQARKCAVFGAARRSVPRRGRARSPGDDGAPPHLRQATLARHQPRTGDGAAPPPLWERCGCGLPSSRREQTRAQPVGENAGAGERLQGERLRRPVAVRSVQPVSRGSQERGDPHLARLGPHGTRRFQPVEPRSALFLDVARSGIRRRRGGPGRRRSVNVRSRDYHRGSRSRAGQGHRGPRGRQEPRRNSQSSGGDAFQRSTGQE